MADISPKLVKDLRDKTGAGMMDCKKALIENDGDLNKAMDWLRQKGMISAEKKSGRITAEGLVESYIHTGGRVGVLVEVNCQTDFVARNQAFKELARNIAMQIAASPNVEYVRVSDIPPDVVTREKDLEMGRDDLSNKPVNIREKIVEGRIEKRLKEMVLLDQPYVKDPTLTVEELVKQHVAQLGENIQVRRFVRFIMGEGIEKQETDFASEVAAQTGTATEAKKPEASPTAPPPAAEAQLEGATEVKKPESSPAAAEVDASTAESDAKLATVTAEISQEELEILSTYCQQTEKSEAEVLRELIRSLKNQLKS